MILLAPDKVLGLGAVLTHVPYWGLKLQGCPFPYAMGNPPCFATVWFLALCSPLPGYLVTVPADPDQHWSFP